MPIINGDSLDNTLNGTTGDDTINGFAGSDTFNGDLGSDSVDGGTGFDYFVANYSDRTSGLTMTYNPVTGNGTITVGSEVDTLVSIESFSTPAGFLSGGFFGTPFADFIIGTSDGDYFYFGFHGGDGNDTISGGAGDDRLFGEEDNDVLNGDAGNDVLRGDNGDDVLNGGIGDDILCSDAGNDTANGGSGIDSYAADYRDRTSGLSMTYDPATGNGTITVGTEIDTLVSIESFNTYGAGAGLYGGFYGTAFDDLMVGASDGDDIYFGFFGGDGNDTISGGAGPDRLFGEDGDDVLNGDTGNDNLNGGDGNDSLNGGTGDDGLYTDAGSDTINGGTGSDGYAANYSDRTSGLTMTYDPATGNGTITVGTEVDKLVSIESFDNGSFIGTRFDDFIVGSADGNYVYYGIRAGDGNDTISGGAGGDILYGEEGDDVVNGDTGNDNLSGGNGNDSLNGGTGDDGLNTDAGSDTINGGPGIDGYAANYGDRTSALTMTYNATTGNGTITVGTEVDTLVSIESFDNGSFIGTPFDDFIVGSADGNYLYYGIRAGEGNDTISGGAGGDILYGEEGNDVVNGDSGNDNLQGGSGNDTLNGGTGDDGLNTDAGSDSINGGAGFDGYAANYGDRTSALTMTYDPTTGSGTIAVGTEIDTLVSIESFDNGPFYGTPFDDFIVGSADGNYLYYGILGGEGKDTISGGAGGDILYGEAGNDVLNGDTGNDNLVGGIGNDRLDGGEGDDGMTGGAGNDTYTVDSALEGVTEAVGEGSDTVQSSVTFILGPNVEKLTLTGVGAINGTGNSLNNVITGNGAANAINGSTGKDTMIGGAGNDIYTVNNLLDVVTEGSGAGTDLVRSSVALTLGANVENLNLLGSGAINGTGNSLSNTLKGNTGSNILDGTGASLGVGEKDTLTGGTGADVFVLGSAAGRYYDDGAALTGGTGDYAYVADSHRAEGDKLQLKGTAGDYLLGTSPVPGLAGKGVFFDSNHDHALGASDELVAVVKNTSVSLNLDVNYIS